MQKYIGKTILHIRLRLIINLYFYKAILDNEFQKISSNAPFCHIEHLLNKNIKTIPKITVPIIDEHPPLANAPKSPTIDLLTASANSTVGICFFVCLKFFSRLSLKLQHSFQVLTEIFFKIVISYQHSVSI